MKKSLMILMGILTAVTCFGETNWSKSVQMDKNYKFLNRDLIILSNTIAVAAGDLTGTSNSTTVVGLRGKSIPLPGVGDTGKGYVYDSVSGTFLLQVVGAGSSTDTLQTVTLRGNNTAQNLYLLGNYLSFGPTNTGDIRSMIPGQPGLINGGACLGYSVQDIEAAGSINYGYLIGLGGFPPSYACQTNTGFGSFNFGYVSGGAIQGISGSGSMNIGYLGIGESQSTTANGCLNVGANNTASHAYAMVFGNGISSVDTNAIHARKYYVTQGIIPTISNTVDLGSATLPFRQGYFGSNSVYLGDYQVTKGKQQNYDTSYSWGNHALAGYASSNSVSGLSNRVGILELNVNTNNYNAAYSWGNHTLFQYATQTNNNVFTTFQTVSNGSLTVYKDGMGEAGIGFQHLDTTGVSGVKTWAAANEAWIYGKKANIPFCIGAGNGAGAFSIWATNDNVAVLISTNFNDMFVLPVILPLEVHGDMGASGIGYFGTGILPLTSNTVDIGSATMPFRRGYFGDASLYLGDYQVTKVKQQNYDTAYSWGNHASAGYAPTSSVTAVSNQVASINATLGAGTNKWNDAITNNQAAATLGMLTVTGGIVPNSSNTLDIGSQTMPFRQVNVSNLNLVGSSISFNGVEAISKSGNNLVFPNNLFLTNGAVVVGADISSYTSNSLSGPGDGGSTPTCFVSVNSPRYMAVAVENGTFYYSWNHGTNWTASASSQIGQSWSIAGSSDGRVILAYDGNYDYYIWTSYNYGTNFNSRAGSKTSISCSACSSDGNKMYVAGYNVYVKASYDGGTNWVDQMGSLASSFAIACSPSGKYVVSGGASSIYYSSDYGTNWTASSGPSTYVADIFWSADGSHIYAAQYPGSIMVSVDNGMTWVNTSSGSKNWVGVTCSKEGKRLIAAGSSDTTNWRMYTSTDYGATWTLQTGLPTISQYNLGLRASSDGSEFLLHGTGNKLFRLDATYVNSSMGGFAQSGNIVPSGSNTYDLGEAAVPWKSVYANQLRLIPSTPFPAHSAGLLFYHSVSNKVFCSNGSTWNALW